MSENIQHKIFSEAGLVFEPLISLDSAYRVTQLFAELGYELPGGNEFPDFPGLAARVETVIEKLVRFGKATGDQKGQALAELAAELIRLTKEIIDLTNTVSAATAAFPDFINNAPLDQLPMRLLNYIIIEYSKKNRVGLYAVMTLAGIFETTVLDADAGIFQPATSLRTITWSRLPKLLSDPAGLFNDVYKWDTNFDSNKLFDNIILLLRAFVLPGGLYEQSPSLKTALGNTTDKLKEIRFPIFQNATYPSTYSEFGINVTAAEANGSKKAGFAIVPYVHGTANFDFSLSEKWELVFAADASVDSGFGMVIRPGDISLMTGLFTAPLDAVNLDASLAVRQKANAGEIILFGEENASRLAYEGAGARVFIKKGKDNDAGIEIKLDALRLIISGGDGDGFLSKLLGDGGINAETGFVMGYSLQQGFYFIGSGGLELQLAVHITLGPLEIQGITIAIKFKEDDIVIEGGVTFKVSLGPMVAVVENIGVTGTINFPNEGGNLGPANLAIGFKPPNGVGLSLDAGAVKGGGYLFFDFDKEEYAGALELTIVNLLSAKAIGLITTKMPDGSKGFSLLIIITVEFFPPFQLGYGFTLNGVGGLIGLNRTVKLDPLRDGVRTGAVNSIMFPQNVIANAPRIISDLKTIFPPYEGRFLIGPMGKLGWGTPSLITLSLGLIIEIPGNIAILGVLRIALPEENTALINIQVNFVGTIDFDKKMLTFDASLFDSRILLFTLEGDMAVRLKWGDDPDFILTVGGFHPSYTPPPLALPSLKRLAISILNTDYGRIRIECYQAVTSNTVQFGAKAEVYFGFSAFSIDGHIGFDALFQFSPFYFIIQVSASFSLKAFGVGVFSVRVRMSLEGPTPWRAKGTGSISLLFFEISADFDKTWGENKNTSLPDIEILPRLLEELGKREQWHTYLPAGTQLLVSLRKLNESTESLVLHPAGVLVLQQRILPLDLDIDKVGNQKTSDIKRAAISQVNSAGNPLTATPVTESFARAQYQNMSDADKLSKPSFEKLHGGVSITMGGQSVNTSKMVRRMVKYEEIIIDKEPRRPLKVGQFLVQIGALFMHFLKGTAATKSTLSKKYKDSVQPFAEKVTVKEEGYTVVFTDNNKAYSQAASFSSEAMAADYMKQQVGMDPNLKEKIQVISTYEMN